MKSRHYFYIARPGQSLKGKVSHMNDTTAVQIVEAIADEKNVEPSELDYRLHDYVETDVLRLLARSERDSWTLSFEVPDGDVTVTGEGGIYLDFAEESDQVTYQAAVD